MRGAGVPARQDELLPNSDKSRIIKMSINQK